MVYEATSLLRKLLCQPFTNPSGSRGISTPNSSPFLQYIVIMTQYVAKNRGQHCNIQVVSCKTLIKMMNRKDIRDTEFFIKYA